MLYPAILASPSLGARNPVRIFMVVVFPAPFGPRKATTCPRGIEKETSLTATKSP